MIRPSVLASMDSPNNNNNKPEIEFTKTIALKQFFKKTAVYS